MSERTVAAISTPAGEGGISVIRISGDDAITVADRCFRSFSGKKLEDLKGYEACYGNLISENEVIDDAVALVFRAPKSYTGENVVEISVHGGFYVSRAALRAVVSSGAYAAAGGEFTKRAFLNGKLDLAKAESVIEIIGARNDAALKISRAAKDGRVSRETESICSKLLEAAANIAAYSDFPDEDIEGLKIENFSAMLFDTKEKLKNLLCTYDAGKVIREGIDCVIVGKPNVGKSTLMNLLCGSDRSIVTEVAGTTRDVIESTVSLGNLTLNISDTAGIHETADTVEKAGVNLALKRLDTALLTLAVFDVSAELDSDDRSLINKLDPEHTVIVLNKSDLEKKADVSAFKGFKTVTVSAKEDSDTDKIQRAVQDLIGTANLRPEDTVLISERQRDCVFRAYKATESALNSLSVGFTLDAVGVCVDEAVAALLELTGKRVTNEVCDEVFRRFCIGK